MAEIRLEFDGLKLEVIDTGKGVTLRSCPAFSGRVDRQSSTESYLVGTGPIPTGDRSIFTTNEQHGEHCADALLIPTIGNECTHTIPKNVIEALI